MQALILPHCSRREAIEFAREVLKRADDAAAVPSTATSRGTVNHFSVPEAGGTAELVSQVACVVDASRQLSSTGAGCPTVLCAGVASVDTPPKNFDAGRLFEAAQRCLLAAHASGGQVKSIELY
jgi:hypothetical protein